MFMRIIFLSFLMAFSSLAIAGLELKILGERSMGRHPFSGTSFTLSIMAPFSSAIPFSPEEEREKLYRDNEIGLALFLGVPSSPIWALGLGSDKAIEGSRNSVEEDSSSSFSENAYDDESEWRKDSTEEIY